MHRGTTRLQQLRTHLAPQYSATVRRPMSSATNGEVSGHITWPGVSLADLPKSHTFTTHLPPDPIIPSPQVSKEAPPQYLRVSRLVRGALFTWVAPEKSDNPQLLATSWKALRDLGLKDEEVHTEDFRQLMSGNKIYEEHYPWGNCVEIVVDR